MYALPTVTSTSGKSSEINKRGIYEARIKFTGIYIRTLLINSSKCDLDLYSCSFVCFVFCCMYTLVSIDYRLSIYRLNSIMPNIAELATRGHSVITL